MNNKIVFFDVDNTLYDNSKHKVPLSTKIALDKLKKDGYALCLATGREFSFIPDCVCECIQWDGYVCCNGQEIYDRSRKLLRSIYIDNDSIQECCRIASKTDSTLEIRTERGCFLYNQPTDCFKEAFKFLNRPIWNIDTINPNDQVKMMLVSRANGKSYKDFQEIPRIIVSPTAHQYADINSCMCTKYEGIQFYMKLFNYQEYIAVGDSMNDYDMIKNASYSIAMKNGEKAIKEMSDYITDTVTHDGIAIAVDQILKI